MPSKDSSDGILATALQYLKLLWQKSFERPFRWKKFKIIDGSYKLWGQLTHAHVSNTGSVVCSVSENINSSNKGQEWQTMLLTAGVTI